MLGGTLSTLSSLRGKGKHIARRDPNQVIFIKKKKGNCGLKATSASARAKASSGEGAQLTPGVKPVRR